MGAPVLDLFHQKGFEFTACMFWASDPAVVPLGILEQMFFIPLTEAELECIYSYKSHKTGSDQAEGRAFSLLGGSRRDSFLSVFP